MQNVTGFGITSGGIGTTGSCAGGNTVSLIPWLKAAADAEGTDLEAWLKNYADGVSSFQGQREESENAEFIALATTTVLLPCEVAQIRQAMSEFGPRTQNIAIGEFITDMRKEEAEAKSAPAPQPAATPAPASVPMPQPSKATKGKSASKKKSTKSKTATGRKPARRKSR